MELVEEEVVAEEEERGVGDWDSEDLITSLSPNARRRYSGESEFDLE